MISHFDEIMNFFFGLPKEFGCGQTFFETIGKCFLR
jgi:hypothetical protein